MQLQTGISFRTCTLLARATIVTKQANRPPGEDAVPTRPGPTVQRRRLGIELRRLREAAGKTIDEVAQVLECSDSKVSRIENGQVSASPRDVRDMLEFYRVDPRHRDGLVEFARMARQRGWWEAYSETDAVPLVGLEVAAEQILAYEAMVIYGLFQTEDYAQAQVRSHRPDISIGQVRRRVEFRIARQELLTRDAPPRLEVILEECALRRPVGGRKTMRKQLQHLTEIANMPAVSLQVLPLSVGEHAGMSGSFSIYRFSHRTDPDVVYLEHTTSDLYIENTNQVERYGIAFDRLRTAALSPGRSIAFIESLVEGPI
jgi:transcriptional regulator with XRE-family HTH domain